MYGTSTTNSVVRHKAGRAGFSLVEMLAVMGIIVLMVAIGVSAFKGLGSTATRRGAVSNVMGTLDHARMMAISDGRAAYVVFACRVPSSEVQVNPELWNRAYAIFQDADNVDFNPVQVTAWMYLPNNMAFKAKNDLVDSSSATVYSVTSRCTDIAPSGIDPAFALRGVALPAGKSDTIAVKLPYIKFDNTGMIANEQDPGRLRLLMFPGTVDSSGSEVYTQNNGGGSGAAKQQAFLEEIDLNPVTGRARYVNNPADNLLAAPSPSFAAANP